MRNYNGTEELLHYGVLGMKWGVRRYQNKDGSLTPAGRNRYDKDIENAKTNLKDAEASYKKSYNKYNKATLGGLVYNEQASKDLRKASAGVIYAKKELSDTRIKSKMDGKEKSKRQTKLEQKYKEQGMTQDEAELAAYKRVKTEKVLAAIAGTTMVAATAYVAYKHYDNNVDKIIKSGTLLQNISTNSNKGVSDAFYASKTKRDNIKYRGLYGNTLKFGPLGGENNAVYETKIGINKNLKLASTKSATKALEELVTSDRAYAKNLKTHLTNLSDQNLNGDQIKTFRKAIDSLNSGKVDTNVYEALNLGLADHSPTGQSVSKGFYDKLKTKGYDAIKDINDAKYSGYKSTNPLIVFNGGSKTAVGSVRELGANEIQKSKNIGNADIAGTVLAKSGATYAAAILGTKAAVKAVVNKNDAKIVSDYRKKHPESTLSYNEIIRNYKS